MGRNLAKVGNNAKYPARSPLDGFPTGFVTQGVDGSSGDGVASADQPTQTLRDQAELTDAPTALDLGDSRSL